MPSTKGFILPAAFGGRQQLESLKGEFLQAANKYPGLRYGWMALTLPEAPHDSSYLEAEIRVLKFNTAYPRLVAEAAAGNRKVVEIVPPNWPTADDTLEMNSAFGLAYAKAFREEFGFATVTHRFFMDDSLGDGAALRLFKELEAATTRCREGKEDGPTSAINWLDSIIWLSDAGRDPILRMYRISLEISSDRKTFYAGATPFAAVPEGQAVSIDGEHRPWIDLLHDLTQCNFYISLLECGLFRASAYAIDKLLDEDLGLLNPPKASVQTEDRDTATSADAAGPDESKATATEPPRDVVAEDQQGLKGAAAQSDVGDGVAVGLAQPDFPNPSKPISKHTAAGAWGGAMTVDKLTSLMKARRVRYVELNRQLFIFCCDDVSNLEPGHKSRN